MSLNSDDINVSESVGLESLLSQPISDEHRQWCCLYTRPRHEKSIARVCLNEGVDFYLPLVKRVKRYKSGRKVRWLPLFTGYVFCYADEISQHNILSQENLLGLLKVPDEICLVSELREIYHALKVTKELSALDDVKEGQEAEIIAGPFKGIKGIVTEIKNTREVFLNIHFIGRSTPVEVRREDIELL